MSMQDLRGFIELLEESGELWRINVPVDPVLEIAEITARVCKQPEGKALFFEHVNGHEFPVVTNLFGSQRRMGWALWTDRIELLAQRIARDLEKVPGGCAEERLQLLVESATFLPRLIKQAPCQEVILREDADLSSLPALKSWPEDGGRYITLPMVFSREPVTGRMNCGMYRLQILDGKRAAIHWGEHADGARHYRAWQARGKPMPMAVALGGDPVLNYAAGVPLPGGIDEVAFAGYLRQLPVSMARCVSCDLEVPASAEIVIEGVVDPVETRMEGPFGNHTGYYTPAAPAPVFHVTAITQRRKAIYPCTVVGPPPMEDIYLAKATERLFMPLICHDFPVIQDLNFPIEGIFHGCALISLRPGAAGEGRRLLERLWHYRLFKESRMLVVFNSDVNVQNPSEVYWQAINLVRADRDVVLDGNRIGIDATKIDHRRRVSTDPVTVDLITQRWTDYGFPK